MILASLQVEELLREREGFDSDLRCIARAADHREKLQRAVQAATKPKSGLSMWHRAVDGAVQVGWVGVLEVEWMMSVV